MARIDFTRVPMKGTANPCSVAVADAAKNLPLNGVGNGGQFDLTGGEIIVIENPTVGAITATLLSVNDAQGRTGDQAQAIAASGVGIFGPLKQEGWRQADGKAYLEVSADGLKVVLLTLA